MTIISENYAAFFNWLVLDYSGDIVPTPRKDLSIKYRNEKKIECCENYFGAQPVQKMTKMLNDTALETLQKAKVMILLSLPGENQLYEKLEKETEILAKDTQNRITKIQLKDGSVMFEGDYTPERWRNQREENGRFKQSSSLTDRQNLIGNNLNTRKRNGSSLFDGSDAGVSESGKRRRASSPDGFTSGLTETSQMNKGIKEKSSSSSPAPAPGKHENQRTENVSNGTNSFTAFQLSVLSLSASEIQNLRKGRPYLRQITLKGPNWNLTDEEHQQALPSAEHFRTLLEDLQSFFKNRRNYKLDAKLEEVKRFSGDKKTSPASIAGKIPVMIQNLCKCPKSQHGLLVSTFYEDMEAFVATSRNQDVQILGKKRLGRERRALMKKMNVRISYDDIKTGLVDYLEILARFSASM